MLRVRETRRLQRQGAHPQSALGAKVGDRGADAADVRLGERGMKRQRQHPVACSVRPRTWQGMLAGEHRLARNRNWIVDECFDPTSAKMPLKRRSIVCLYDE